MDQNLFKYLSIFWRNRQFPNSAMISNVAMGNTSNSPLQIKSWCTELSTAGFGLVETQPEIILRLCKIDAKQTFT